VNGARLDLRPPMARRPAGRVRVILLVGIFGYQLSAASSAKRQFSTLPSESIQSLELLHTENDHYRASMLLDLHGLCERIVKKSTEGVFSILGGHRSHGMTFI